MGHNVATVAKDEKILLPTTVYAKNRYQDHIWYDESGPVPAPKGVGQYQHPKGWASTSTQRGGPVPAPKGVGKYLATDVMKVIKLYWLLDLSPMNPSCNFYSNRKNSNLYLHIRSIIDDYLLFT